MEFSTAAWIRFSRGLQVHFNGNEPLVKALVAAGVEFVVIGGLAVSWHCTSRLADDLDLLLAPTPENSKRVAHALASLGLRGFSAKSFVTLGLQVPLKTGFYADLLTPQSKTESYFIVKSSSVDAKLFNIPVRLASIPALIEMKRLAAETTHSEQRKKHLHDIALLESTHA